jgi:hypothetical protein
VKELLVDEAGGRCALCGYDRHVAALEFHHVDPASKRFALGADGLTRALEVMRREALRPMRDEVRAVRAELGTAAGLIGAGFVGFEAADG